jgi:PAS domain S-box-containing protein
MDFSPGLRLAIFLCNSLFITGFAEAMHRVLWRLGEAEGQRAETERFLIASEKSRLTQAAEAIAAFDLDIEKNPAKDVDALRRIFGFGPGTVVNPQAVLRTALPEDVPNIKAALNAAFDAAGDGVYKADYRIRLVGLSHYKLHPDIPDRWKAIHRGVLKGEFHSDVGDYWIDADGQEHWVRWAAYPWSDEMGGIGGFVLSAEEISAQKRAEAALRESEEKFRNAFAEAAVGFVMGEAGGAVLEANNAFCRLTGYSADELTSMRFVDLIHPDDKARNNALDDRLRTGDIPGYVVENRYLRKDGAIIWVRKSASLTHGAGGGHRWVVNLVEDVTERKRSEETAARTVAQLSAILDGATDAVISIDVAGIVQSINAAGERMFGYESGEVVGRSVSMLKEMPDATTNTSPITCAPASGRSSASAVRQRDGARTAMCFRSIWRSSRRSSTTSSSSLASCATYPSGATLKSAWTNWPRSV